MNITGIILAGGLSSRMGTDKGIIQLDEQKMIEKVITALEGVADSIIISANNSNYNQFGYEVVEDRFEKIGPLGGIISCLEKSHTNRNLVVSCDTPNISTRFLSTLLENTENFDAVIPFHHGHFEPLAAYYHKNSLPKLIDSEAEYEYKLQHIIRKLNYKKICFPDDSATVKQFFNINNKSDLFEYYDY